MLLAPIALYIVIPVTRSKPGILQRLVCRLVKTLDKVTKAANMTVPASRHVTTGFWE